MGYNPRALGAATFTTDSPTGTGPGRHGSRPSKATLARREAGATVKILHVITGLSTGGAEMMLFKLLSRLVRENVGNEVISLTGIGPVGERIAGLGIGVGALGMGRTVPSPLMIFSLARMMREARPDVVHSWMYHANLLAGLA